MSVFFLSLLLIALVVMVIICLGFYWTNSAWLLSLILISCLSLTIYFNPDLYHWFLYEKDRQSYLRAQAILKNPQSIVNLVQKLERRVTIEPSDAKAWFLLGRIHAGQDNWEKAHDALFQAYRLNPKDIKTAIFYVETIWHVQGRLNALARHILHQVLRQEPKQADALMLLATEARQRNCPKEALPYLQELRQLFLEESEISRSIDKAIKKANQADDSECEHASEV
jgi:cytochrome c-type biogenesis protein CcmH/NrfG